MTINNLPGEGNQVRASAKPEYPAPVPAREHVANDIRQSRDRAQYVRQQKGHSLFFWLFIGGPITLWIPTLYYSLSPNHFWRA